MFSRWFGIEFGNNKESSVPPSHRLLLTALGVGMVSREGVEPSTR
jgi:hypothetical protein